MMMLFVFLSSVYTHTYLDTALIMAYITSDLPAVFVQNTTAKRQIREVSNVSFVQYKDQNSVILLFNGKQFQIDQNSYFIYPRLDGKDKPAMFCIRFENMSYLEVKTSTSLIKKILDWKSLRNSVEFYTE